MQIKFKKVREVETPIYATQGAAAMDLFAATEGEYNEVGDYYEYKTGLKFQIPQGHVGILAPRSSITNKSMMLANNLGIIDEDFRGEVSVRLKFIRGSYKGSSITPYKKGERIAQLIVLPYPKITLLEVDELDETVRGEGGYGSTGLSSTDAQQSMPTLKTATILGNGGSDRPGVSRLVHMFPIGAKVTILRPVENSFAGAFEVSCEGFDNTQVIASEHLKFDSDCKENYIQENGTYSAEYMVRKYGTYNWLPLVTQATVIDTWRKGDAVGHTHGIPLGTLVDIIDGPDEYLRVQVKVPGEDDIKFINHYYLRYE
jgi:dUTP pyrophosphatase